MSRLESEVRLRLDPPSSLRGPASASVVAGFGFWLYLLSDIILFSAFFASYAVLSGQTDGGPGGRELFDRTNVFVETALLLASSFTCGLAGIRARKRRLSGSYAWLAATLLLGGAFLALEFREFRALAATGNGPSRSAFLSAFFSLVGLHGIHVLAGIAWGATMMLQLRSFGFRPMVQRRLYCFALFWHALDIVWVGVFTIVYLGASP